MTLHHLKTTGHLNALRGEDEKQYMLTCKVLFGAAARESLHWLSLGFVRLATHFGRAGDVPGC